MSTLQVANVHLESTGNNRIQYTGSNTITIYAGGAAVAVVNSNGFGINSFSDNVSFDTDTLFVDANSDRVGVNTSSPSVSLTIAANDAILVPTGSDAQRPTAANGMLRYSTTTNSFEGYANGAWGAIGGGGGLFTEASSGVWETPAITSAEIDGDLIVTGDATSLSDERYKENIVQITNALDIVDSMNGVYYNLIKSPEKRSVGVIAQNVEQVLPEVVYEADGFKSVAYGNMMGVLIEAIKELRKEIKELKDGI